MIGAFYLYEQGSSDDAAFGFFDIELSVQSLGPESIRVEVYCIADGYQSSRGVGANHPLQISVMSGDTIVATAQWRFADVICGHADPMHFSTDLPLAGRTFADIDRVALESVEGWSTPCEETPRTAAT